MKEKIKNTLNKGYVRYIIVFFIIFSLVFMSSLFFVNELRHNISEKDIKHVDFTVVDKIIKNDTNHTFLIISDDNKTYEIPHNNNGIKMFNNIELKKHYHFTIKDTNNTGHLYIIQVYNERNNSSV